MKGEMEARLVAAGWKRDDGPYDEMGECVDTSGCVRAARWSHASVSGGYCAQHADGARRNRLGDGVIGG